MSGDFITYGVAAAKAVGGAVKVAGALKAGSTAKQAAEFNARASEESARTATAAAALEVVRNRRLASKAQGSIRAAAGGSGIAVSGSVMDVLEESAALAEEDALLIKNSGDRAAINFRNNATLDRFTGKQAKSASRISAASSLLSTAVNVAGGFI